LSPEILQKIDELSKYETENLKTIYIGDFAGLYLRVYGRKGVKEISPIQFIPPKILKYIADTVGSCCSNEGYNYRMYAEAIFDDITKTKLKDLMLDFKAKSNKVKVAFRDNYEDGAMSDFKAIKEYFEVETPIKFLDFLEKLFDHFDKVGLPGYPDNGGIDCIKYDAKDDIYLVSTWS